LNLVELSKIILRYNGKQTIKRTIIASDYFLIFIILFIQSKYINFSSSEF